MSSVIKGIGKVFKAVGKVVKTVLPIALAVGAVVFTAGAALAPASALFAGGFGGAISSTLGAIGIEASSGIGAVIAGAATQAGYGAAVGALTSAVSGGNVMNGLQSGALTGAITGGITGAVAPQYIDPLHPGIADKLKDTATMRSAVTEGAVPQQAAIEGATTQAGSVPAFTPPPPTQVAADSGGGFFGKNGLLSSPLVAGGLIGGVGSAVGGIAQAGAEKDLANQARLQTMQNYANPGNGLLVPGTGNYTPPAGTPTPQQRYDYTQGGQYQWDPGQRKIVFVPYNQPGAPASGGPQSPYPTTTT